MAAFGPADADGATCTAVAAPMSTAVPSSTYACSRCGDDRRVVTVRTASTRDFRRVSRKWRASPARKRAPSPTIDEDGTRLDRVLGGLRRMPR